MVMACLKHQASTVWISIIFVTILGSSDNDMTGYELYLLAACEESWSF